MKTQDLTQYYIKRQLLEAYWAAKMFGNEDIAELAKKQFKRLE